MEFNLYIDLLIFVTFQFTFRFLHLVHIHRFFYINLPEFNLPRSMCKVPKSDGHQFSLLFPDYRLQHFVDLLFVGSSMVTGTHKWETRGLRQLMML